MSVTVHTYPIGYVTGFNPQWFVATSTQVASANFTYTVKCTDVITSATATYEIEQRPDTKLAFDASNFAKNYIEHYIPNNEYGWKKCVDAIRKIRVNIGETYGTTPAYVSGSNIDYIVWNGVLKWLDYPGYDQDDFVYANSTSNYKYLTSLRNPSSSTFYKPDAKTYSDKSYFLYALTSENNDLEFIRINAYDASGNLIRYSDIANPYEASTTYTDKMLCIDCGRKGLDNIASGLVTGSYPIIPANCAYYDVIDAYTMPPATARKNIVRIYVESECKYDVYVLHFLDKDGNFETINFQKLSETTVQADKTYYRQNPYEMNSNVWAYTTFSKSERTLNSSTTTRIKLNSDWFSEEQIDAYRYLVSSPVVYMDMGSTIGLIPVKVNTNNYLVNKKFNNKLYNLTIDIEYTHKDIYQNG